VALSAAMCPSPVREIGGGVAPDSPLSGQETTMPIVRLDSSRDLATLQQQETLSRVQMEHLSRMLGGYYRCP
jgi:hypothetical protein